jgi:hypothetical protein
VAVVSSGEIDTRTQGNLFQTSAHVTGYWKLAPTHSLPFFPVFIGKVRLVVGHTTVQAINSWLPSTELGFNPRTTADKVAHR